MLPFSKVFAKKWVNVHAKMSFIDNTFGAIPIIGNVLSGVISLPTLMTKHGVSGVIANIGGQLGAENGAHNIMLDVPHAHALTMYKKAREEIKKAPLNPGVISIK